MKRREFSSSEVQAIVAAYATGVSIKELAKTYSCSTSTILKVVDPDTYRARQDRYNRLQREQRKEARNMDTSYRAPDGARSLHSAALLPPDRDERDFTGRIMGDPFPGRSALDRKRAALLS